MEELLHEFHFLRPWVLLFLIIPIVYFFYVFKNDANLSSWEKVCDKKLLEFLLVRGTSAKRKFSVMLMYMGLIFAILGEAGPAWKKTQREAASTNNPLMIVLNLSSNMLFTDIKPNRLTMAKIEITQLLEQAKSVESGLIVYTTEPFLISPLSADVNLVINLLKTAVDETIMPVNGDNMERAINMAVTKIRDSGYESGNIVVFTADSGGNFEGTVNEAKKALNQKIRVSVVNMSLGTNNKLMKIAQNGGGKYLQSGQDIKPLADFILSLKNQIQLSKNKASDWEDYGWYLLFVPLFCCVHFFRRGVLVILFLLSIPHVAQAGFWFSDNQLAMKDFNAKKYENAAETFSNKKWKASALYRAGDYENAAQLFKNEKDVDSLYNYGNAVAKSGNIDEAIKAYEEVLKQNKNHKDAKFNLDYLKKQKQDNKSKNQKDNKDQNDKQSQNEQNQNQQNQEQKKQQNQSAQNEQQENEDKQDQAKAQNAQVQAQAEDEKKNEQSQDNSKDNKENNQNKKQEQTVEKQKAQQANMKQGDKDEKYDEEVQAREQKFREIPEDKGGLLRLFIQKEYSKNRYGE